MSEGGLDGTVRRDPPAAVRWAHGAGTCGIPVSL